MGIMQVNQIRNRLFEEYTGLIDLEDAHDRNKENFFLTRALASYAIQCLCEGEKEEFAKSITDGSRDNGIDAIYFDKDYEELFIVQSKWNHKGDSEPDLGEIKKFVDGVEDLISLKFHKFNEKVNERKEEIKGYLLNPKTKLKVVLAYTANNLSDDSKNCFDELLQRQNDSSEGTFLEIMNQSRLHASLIDSSSSEPINIQELYLTEWGKRTEPKLAYYGQVDAKQISDWWKMYGNRLFTKNIRKLLGDSTINEEIRNTIDVDPENFWYYNNGITIICDDISKRRVNGDNRDFGVFDCEDAFIVNGAQTVGTIGKYSVLEDEMDTLDNVKVFVRIISLKDTGEDSTGVDKKFAENVTKNNNRQNKIQNRDFVSLDEQQKRIASELAVEGIYYHVMRSDEVTTDDINFDLEESTVALSCASDIDAATLAHRETGKIWSDLNHSRYKKLFNPSVTSFYVWNTVKIYREISASIHNLKEEVENEQEAILTYGEELIACSIFNHIGTSKIGKYNIDTSEFFSSVNLDKLVQSKLAAIIDIIDEYGNNISNIFKNFAHSKDIFERVQHSSSDVDVSPAVADVSIDSVIETKFQGKNRVKARLYNFDNKVSGDELAVRGFSYWLENIYDPNSHEIGIVSNIHFYLKGESDRNQRFLFRIKYGKELTIEFTHNSYGINYTSLLFEKENFQEWLTRKTDDNLLSIKSEEDLKFFQEIKEFI
ncbi:AIPR family protein [Thalassobacillus sp. CUG 92003]|uniref:AIPR family protein n=1 Tax=Thalassobacillus sp. CUG 92003 TaxID=2736641 RepID=UPI0015E6E742|nr:AIPR family protein [Thalassobacillus sp. CUG 92003]